MPFDPEKVPVEHADLFYHGRPGADGGPVGLTDSQYDGLKAELRERGEWPFDQKEESNG
jgi:hypothetical protein